MVVSEKQYRVYGIEYIVKKGKEMQGKLVFSRWYLVFSEGKKCKIQIVFSR